MTEILQNGVITISSSMLKVIAFYGVVGILSLLGIFKLISKRQTVYNWVSWGLRNLSSVFSWTAGLFNKPSKVQQNTRCPDQISVINIPPSVTDSGMVLGVARTLPEPWKTFVTLLTSVNPPNRQALFCNILDNLNVEAVSSLTIGQVDAIMLCTGDSQHQYLKMRLLAFSDVVRATANNTDCTAFIGNSAKKRNEKVKW